MCLHFRGKCVVASAGKSAEINITPKDDKMNMVKTDVLNAQVPFTLKLRWLEPQQGEFVIEKM